MRIANTDWFLQYDGSDYWVESSRVFAASKEKYDSVDIIYYPKIKGFRPIVLAEKEVFSETDHDIKDFYKTIVEGLKLKKGGHFLVEDLSAWRITRLLSRDYRWGCRDFTRAQLRLIKKEMERVYTKKQLGIK